MSHVVVITGGGTGIGAACAQRMVAAGNSVFIIGRTDRTLNATAYKTGAIPLVGNAASTADWQEKLLPEIGRQAGHIDTLICSAGGMGFGAAGAISDEAWQAAIDTNLTSAFASARACLPRLIASRGSVLFVASIASRTAGPEACAYITAKHALIGLMRSIARDYGPQGVRANAICPGWVTTPMADEEMQPLMQAHGLTLEEAYRRVCRDVPLRRPATTQEIACACEFLCSCRASIISGAILTADGGASAVDVPTLAFSL